MSCTRMGRIRKLIKKNKAKRPRVTEKKTPECYITINYYAMGVKETERRLEQIKILEKISKEGFRPKKGGPGAKRKVKAPKEGDGKRKKK